MPPRKRKKKQGTFDSVADGAKKIIAAWTRDLQRGLGGARIQPAVYRKYSNKLRAHIEERLKKNTPFTKKDKKNSTTVARDLGRMLRLLVAKTRVVDHDTFQEAFRLVRDYHETCPRTTGGAGGWCEID